MYLRALNTLTGVSSREDFSSLIDSPGWEFISSVPSLSQTERFLALAFCQATPDLRALFCTAGLVKDNTTPVREVKAFWRRVANKVIRYPLYKSVYRRKLDTEFKANKQGDFVDLAASCLGSASKSDYHHYEMGQLPLEQLRVRAKLYTLSVFLGDLFKCVRDV